jgi:hypothetical protein
MLLSILPEFLLPESTCGIPRDAGVVKGFTGKTTDEFHASALTRGQPLEGMHNQVR